MHRALTLLLFAGLPAAAANSNQLLGDPGGLRTLGATAGIDLSLSETSEILGNLTGGTHTGADYEGLATAVLTLDTARAFGWQGGSFNVSSFQIHGRDLSTDNLQTLQNASGIEAERATRLWELWYQQQLLPNDALDLRIGKQSIDNEFLISPNSAIFVNAMTGWAVLPSIDMPGGGPIYPIGSPGVRVRYRIDPALTVLAGAFTANPGGAHAIDAQASDRSGTLFPLAGATFTIAELQWSASPTSGYRLGAWHEAGITSVYGIADHGLWQDPGDSNRSVAVFARIMGNPRNGGSEIDFSANAGLVWHGPYAAHDADSLGIGFGTAVLSRDAVRAARLAADRSGSFDPVRGSESFAELTYTAAITPWLNLQPDAQYVFFPGGGIADASHPRSRIGNEAVIGLRGVVQF